MILAYFQVWALGCEVGPVFHFGEVGAVPGFFGVVTVSVLIFAALFLPVNGGNVDADRLGDLLRLFSVPEVLEVPICELLSADN